MGDTWEIWARRGVACASQPRALAPRRVQSAPRTRLAPVGSGLGLGLGLGLGSGLGLGLGLGLGWRITLRQCRQRRGIPARVEFLCN